jgi:acyl-coenzyme A thioesterase PaaI-like protein
MKTSREMFLGNNQEKEIFRMRVIRILFNLIPSHFFSGGRIIYMSKDYKSAIARVKKTWITRGIFGNVFGGVMYSSLDHVPMAMAVNIFGKKYVIWDKFGDIKYIKPAYTKHLYSYVTISDEQLKKAYIELEKSNITILKMTFDLVDKNGKLYATLSKDLHVEDKTHYLSRKKIKEARSS